MFSADRRATTALAVLVIAVLALAAWAPWHSPFSVDNRTYLDMIDGVRRHGLPYIANGPVLEFNELRPRFHFPSHGVLWGQYPPVYPYVAAPAMALGGVRLVFQQGLVLIAVLAVVTFIFGRELSGSARVGVLASWLLVGGSSVIPSYFETLSQPLHVTFVVLAAYAVLRALRCAEPRRERGWASAAGAFAGLAMATHLAGFPCSVAILTMLVVVDSDAGGFVLRVRPSKRAIARAACAFALFALLLVPVSWLAWVKWGAWNPLSYGPCIWRPCAEFGKDELAAHSVLRFAAPGLAWVAALGVALVAVRAAPRGRPRVWWTAIVLAAFACVLVLVPVVRDRAWAIARLAYFYVVDPSASPREVPLTSPPTPVGVMSGPYVLLALVQCSPMFAVVLTAPLLPHEERGAVLFALAAPAALFAALALFVNLPTGHALGFPFMFMRYGTTAVPFLAVGTAIVVRAIATAGTRTRTLRIAMSVLPLTMVVGGGALLLRAPTDMGHVQRLVLTRGTLGVACLSLMAVAVALRVRRSWAPFRWVAGLSVAIAVGAGGAVAALHTVRMMRLESTLDERQDALARVTPQRFAVIGYPRELDTVLPVRTWKDVEAADLIETDDWSHSRRLLDRWMAEGRPIYFVKGDAIPLALPWADVRFEPVDPDHGVYRMKPPATETGREANRQ